MNQPIFFIEIEYCIENRTPTKLMVFEENLSENLVEFCLKNSTGINYFSFDDYYDQSEMYTVYRLYPYIQFEEGLQWNVPYQDVTISDFIRTFPQVKKDGLRAFANNVGGADEIFNRLYQDWNAFYCETKIVLESVGIWSVVDILDWAARVSFVYQRICWLKKSFSKSKKKKPPIRSLKDYILKKKEWNIVDLANNLYAKPELLQDILESQGYVTKDGISFTFDKNLFDRILEQQEIISNDRDNKHGTDVNCHSMNCVVEQLNVDLLYWAVLEMERGSLDDYDVKLKEILLPLKEYSQYVFWDEIFKCVKIAEELPKGFSREDESQIFFCLSSIDEQVNEITNKIEKNNCARGTCQGDGDFVI